MRRAVNVQNFSVIAGKLMGRRCARATDCTASADGPRPGCLKAAHWLMLLVERHPKKRPAPHPCGAGLRGWSALEKLGLLSPCAGCGGPSPAVPGPGQAGRASPASGSGSAMQR